MNGYKNSVIYYISSLLAPLAGRVLNGVSISPKEPILINGEYLVTHYDFTLSAHEEDDFFPVEVKLPIDVMRIDNAQVDDRPVLIDHINISHKMDPNGKERVRFDLVNSEGISTAWFTGTIRENHVNNLGLITPGLVTKTFSVSAVLKPVETSTESGSSEIDLRALAGTVQSVAESLVNQFTCDVTQEVDSRATQRPVGAILTTHIRHQYVFFRFLVLLNSSTRSVQPVLYMPVASMRTLQTGLHTESRTRQASTLRSEILGVVIE